MELRLARHAFILGQRRRAGESAGRAAAIAKQIGDPQLGCEATLIETECHLAGGAPARAVRRGKTLVDQARALGERLEVNALAVLVEAELARGELALAAEDSRRIRGLVRRLAGSPVAGSAARVTARLRLAQGRPAEALEALGPEPGDGRRGRQFGIDGQILDSLLRAAACRARARHRGDAHDLASGRHQARAEAAMVRVAGTLGSPSERKSYRSRWSRERRRIDKLVPE
jgi:ATP/maltotriose-dependent transcriptional regulator MalT